MWIIARVLGGTVASILREEDIFATHNILRSHDERCEFIYKKTADDLRV
jgi:hypothetical protein